MSRRTNRLEEEIREEVAKIIAGELKDPRIGFVTVTEPGSVRFGQRIEADSLRRVVEEMRG